MNFVWGIGVVGYWDKIKNSLARELADFGHMMSASAWCGCAFDCDRWLYKTLREWSTAISHESCPLDPNRFFE